MATIQADTLLDDPGTCTGPFWIIAKTLSGDTIAWDTGIVDIPLSSHLNTIIQVEVKDIPTGNGCTSYYFVEDKQPPAIMLCPNDTVACTASLDFEDLAQLVYYDNCDGDPVASYFDVMLGPDCSDTSQFISVLIREWTVKDAAGNETDCSQSIYILKPDTSNVVLPGNTVLGCSAPSADPSVTGYPTIDGMPVDTGGICNFTVIFEDDTLQNCGGNPLILRTWTVSNNCLLSEVKQGVQQIKFMDFTPPQLDCPDTIIVDTDDGVCSADITLPAPSASDDCSPFFIEAMINGVGTGFIQNNVPKGIYTVVYTATDSCFNFSTCQTTLIIEDNESPTAICDGFKIVSLPNTGQAALPAVVFDNGSTDNCSPLTFSVSLDGVNFGPSVIFDCDDAGDTLMVILRVAELANPASFTDCMNSVWVQDKLPPIINCPSMTAVECTDDYSDLSIFGSPTVIENCDYSLTDTAVIDIDNCGTGTITRTFTVTDESGNAATCSQIILVQNNYPFDGSTIQWPTDYTAINACTTPDSFDPEDLPNAPINYSTPVVPPTNCAMLATSYTDQLFYISFPACYKIVRTWKILDWCQYTPNNPNVGRWTHQQIIAVMDSEPPVITSCPTDTVVTVEADCGLANVVLPPVTATDCSPNLIFTNTSPYNGANASGNYPQGVHPITFTVKDGCGNKSTCDVTITVTDLLPPTPYCNSGIVAELQAMGGQIMATVAAEQFNDNSFDNCTAKQDLEYSMRMAGFPNLPTVPSLTFDCNLLGTYLVEIWVTDEAGNSDFCITDVIIQDNMNLCPPVLDDTLSIFVAGEIETELGGGMPEVIVQAASAGMTDDTDTEGFFELSGLQSGESYTIAPEKDDHPLNGVTTLDLVWMTRHVLGTQLLDSPYKIIAADVNRSGMVTTSDIVELRKLILHVIDDFTNNTSWRFVKKGYVFPDPANPFAEPFPEVLHLTNLSQAVLGADFVGVKIGDMNCSASLDFSGNSAGDRSGSDEMTLLMEDRKIEAGEVFTLPVRLKNYEELIAIQFTLEFETDDLELQGIEEGVLARVGEKSGGLSFPMPGAAAVAWFDTEPVAVTDEDALFSLRFSAKTAGRLAEMLSLTSRFTQALAYDDNENSLNLNLEFVNNDEMTTNTAFQLYQNQPNPFKKSTNISFTLPAESWVKLTIYDLSGQVLKSYDGHFSEGFNQMTIERGELPSGGVLFYQLETDEFTATKKMIVLQ